MAKTETKKIEEKEAVKTVSVELSDNDIRSLVNIINIASKSVGTTNLVVQKDSVEFTAFFLGKLQDLENG